MTAAHRPFSRWSEPRVAEICCSDSTSKLRGREPKLSWLASDAAEVAVKLPVICAWPLGMTAFMEGAVMTVPSRTTAKWLRSGLPL